MTGPVKEKRPSLNVLFECCRVYVRVYRNHSKKFYFGRCPKCMKSVRFEVGSEGSGSRFWKVR